MFNVNFGESDKKCDLCKKNSYYIEDLFGKKRCKECLLNEYGATTEERKRNVKKSFENCMTNFEKMAERKS